MNATDTDYFLYEDLDPEEFDLDEPSLDESEFGEPDLYESAWEFAAATRPHFKDASDFGRACRLLAIPVKRRNGFAEA